MKGRVDSFGRALITIGLKAPATSGLQYIEVWIDTGFNGDLVLPQSVVDRLELPHLGMLRATLADGSEQSLN